MPIPDSDATGLAQRLRSSTAGDLIEERMRQGVQALIGARAARFWHRHGQEHSYRQGYRATPA
jgi:hypothetical protein